MAQSINLIPRQERTEQTKAQLVKVGTIISVFLFLIVLSVTVFVYIKQNNLKNGLKNYETSITKFRSDIESLAQIEISARNLDTKYQTLKSIFDTRVYYSLLLEELAKRVPSSVEIESFSTTGTGLLSISGTGSDYIAIAKFINTLSDSKYASASTGLGPLFKSVTLNSVSLDLQTNKAQYYIVVDFDKGLLKK